MERGSFVGTRERAIETLQAALSGDTACQKAVFEPPLSSQLRVVLAEMGAAELNQWLLSQGQSIDLLMPVETSLEDSYLGLTEEGI